jgi:hypothetical protein
VKVLAALAVQDALGPLALRFWRERGHRTDRLQHGRRDPSDSPGVSAPTSSCSPRRQSTRWTPPTGC